MKVGELTRAQIPIFFWGGLQRPPNPQLLTLRLPVQKFLATGLPTYYLGAPT